MRAGPLRHRVALHAQQRVPDGAGGYSEQWVELRKVWVEITTPTGRVATVAYQIQAVVSAEIRARPANDLQAGRRLVYARKGVTATYLIEAALPDNAHSMLRLLCSSVTPKPKGQ
ncbi:head-tail adaptor protein [Pseudomonas sp. TTU2014-080ASC]|uniref:head-tail adaptor protein n=1 Tax=Pseudomonas sp. TTU2014-080ASC TaxID=1729724 RepID=UPI00071839D2|nr:head-tail adaptor protein [Pseudomonas sp. TTU2014-080ASC]KRW62339.1 head-tail adaptor protein [Pseudomonas sp. TTU2014-080ASC]